mmetsp:Transcript_47664/g.158891  ORF Transcript_47664/g.158891 Transcript_47664/m.158891 type:complete len:791 (+) Transcript_47664:31-2403(+)
MSSSSQAMLDNSAALKKLAALYPELSATTLAAAASDMAAADSSHSRKEGKRTAASSGGEIGAGRLGVPFDLAAEPAWIGERLALLEEIKQRNAAALEALPKPPITVTLPDGKAIEGKAWETSPLDIASGISKGLASATCVASVRYSKRHAGTVRIVDADGDESAGGAPAAAEWEMWDVQRPLEGDCELRLHKWDESAGKETFWHSSAHVLGEALECLYSAQLTHGPPLQTGFFYDSFLGSNSYRPEMNEELEKRVKKICDAKQPFERVVVTKAEAEALFAQNPFKLAIIKAKLPDGAATTVYRSGPFVDLCRGPHLPNTGKVKAFAVTKTSAALWLGKAGNDELQRVYGVSFPDKKELRAWERLQEEAAKRDHRRLGLQQELFFFDEVSPGSSFFLPHGARIYNKLMNMIKAEYFERDYDEVITPNIFNLKLWETSGHAAKYKENMFLLDVEGQEFGLKPMNCPAHCMLFKHRKRSYRELPLRMADFGVLHRNELSGALTGLTRVRRFQQDDAHIFCMVSQIKQEIANVLDMISTIYGWLGMDFSLNLSTKPESALGDAAVWETAEAMIAEALDEYQAKSGRGWSLNPGDGAFYGPKIDIHVYDALKRPFQCATVQLDFVQPQRFDLKYMASGGAAAAAEAPKDGEEESAAGALPPGYERPVMIHRAVLGSVERMIAILTEHFAGKWPFFLSPRQAMVMAVSPAFEEYARAVQRRVRKAGYFVDLDDSHRTLNKMVREAQLSQYNFILVVGKEEAAEAAVNVRTRDNEVHGKKTVEALLADFKQLLADHK